jgi:hypothetical protein
MYEEWKRAMPPLAADIVQGLGLGWSVENDADRDDWCHGFWLAGPGGLRLYVEKGDRYDMPKRVQIIGLYPQDDPHRAHRYSIGCGIAQGGQKIARDVERRLLPDYRAELARAYERIARQESDVCRRFALRDELLEVLAAHAPRLIGHRQDERRSEVAAGHVGKGSLDVQLNNDGSEVKIEARWISADVARAMVAAFAEATAREEQLQKRHLTAV